MYSQIYSSPRALTYIFRDIYRLGYTCLPPDSLDWAMFEIVADALTPLFLGMSAAGAALLTAFCIHIALLRVRVKLSSRYRLSVPRE